MAEQRKQVADNLTALADNITEDITPENVRDAYLSNVAEFVQFHTPPGSLPHAQAMNAAVFVDIDIPGLATITDNWNPAAPPPGSEYVGIVNIGIFGLIVVAFEGSMQEKQYEFRLVKNGVQDDGSVIQCWTGRNQTGARSLVTIPVSLNVSPGDEIKIQMRQIDGGDNDVDLTAFSGWWITRPS